MLQFYCMVYTPDNITDKQLKWGFWWLNNVKNFKMFFVVVFATSVGVLILFNLFSLLMFALKYNNEFSIKNMLAGQPKIAISNTIAPIALEIGEPIILIAGQQSYDIVVPVSNNNDKWFVSKLSYFITYNDGATTTVRNLVINPGQKTYLAVFNLQSDKKLYNVNLEIIDQQWHNASRAKVLPNDFTFTPGQISTDENGIAQRYQTEVTNNSLVNFWEMGWLAVAYSGYQPVAVQEISTEKFLGLSSKTLYFNWFNRLPRIDRVEVTSQFNRFDNTLSFEVETPAIQQ